MLFVISNKLLVHLDEVYSYCLANTETRIHLLPNGNTAIEHLTVPSAHVYFPAKTAFSAVTAVTPGKRFNYANVWRNQQMDTHPPVYYLILHTVCSFFPGNFSVWYAAVINIFFALLLLLLLSLLLRGLTDDTFIQNSVLLAFVCCSAMLNATAFLRMYILAMFLATLEAYLLIKQLDADITPAFCAKLFAVTYLATLTHYHCAVFILLISLVFGYLLLCAKKSKDLLRFSATQIVAGVCAFITFPAMYTHLFHRIRGMQTLSNFVSSSTVTFTDRFALYFGHINRIFGGLFPLLLLFMLYLLVRVLCAKGEKEPKETANITWQRYSLIFIPCTLFFLFIVKTVPYSDWVNDGRYIHIILPLLFCGVLTCALSGLRQLLKPAAFRIAAVTLALLITTGGFLLTNWDYGYLYRDSGNKYKSELSSIYADADCIWLQERDLLLCTLYELSRFRSLIWFDITRFPPEEFKKCKPVNGKLVVCITHFSPIDTDAVLHKYLQNMPEYERYSIIRHPVFFDRGMIYYLEKL